jgi:tRNA-2-methylthio-N6-dimethylallyladenosine synthase
VEGSSKRNQEELCGRTGRNSVVVFPKENYAKGQYVMVEISDCTSATLLGKVISVCD